MSNHTHDDRYFTETESLSLFGKKISYQVRYGDQNEQTIGTDTVLHCCEPTVPYNCYVISHHHITFRSSSAKAKIYWMLKGAYIQGTEQWDGTKNTDYNFDKTFIYEASAGQVIQLVTTNQDTVSAISRANNSSLNRHTFLFIPK